MSRGKRVGDEIKQRIIYLWRDNGKTITEAAKICGVSYTAARRAVMEYTGSGKYEPKPETAAGIAKAGEIDPTDAVQAVLKRYAALKNQRDEIEQEMKSIRYALQEVMEE